jgi:hypothetical protein
MASLAFHCNVLVAELAAHRDGLCEPLDGRVALNNARWHDGDIIGDQARIDAVIFRQSARSASELSQLVRINPPYRQAGCQQDADNATLVTAARPIAAIIAAIGQAAQPASRVVGDTKTAPAGPDRDIQTIHLATVRVWKIRLERQARPRSDSQDARGLPAVTGRLVTAPRRPRECAYSDIKTHRKQSFTAGLPTEASRFAPCLSHERLVRTDPSDQDKENISTARTVIRPSLLE